MTEISFVLFIVAGKEEKWRRALQEMDGSRHGDSERMKRHLGIRTARVWLQRTRRREMAVIRLEVEDPFEAISVLAGSEDAFERWLKRRIEEFHGVDVAHARCNTAPELVFHSGPEDEA